MHVIPGGIRLILSVTVFVVKCVTGIVNITDISLKMFRKRAPYPAPQPCF